MDLIEDMVLQQLHRSLRKVLPSSVGTSRRSKVGRVGPPANGQENLEVTVLLLQEIQLFDTAIDIVASIRPGVTGVMFLNISPRVCHIDFPRFRAHICKGVEHVREPLDRKILGIMVAPVNCLDSEQRYSVWCEIVLTQLTK